MMKRGVKLTALAVLVVLALTGFSTGHKSGSKSRHRGGSSSGGGCSSSSQRHDTSSHTSSSSSGSYGSGYSGTRRSTRRATPTSTGSTGPVEATVKLVRCASAGDPYATVQITNSNRNSGYFRASVDFRDADGQLVGTAQDTFRVGQDSVATVRLKVPATADASRIERCVAVPTAPYVR
ncbi:hypothetical protein GTY65_28940 [Streptomyces sp. SID8379]|uniref:hypothetical protein n=1 Tax=unclassified Streptomyces TaxID=2593676 RepID=UPI00039E0D97|nr:MULTISPECIES: hypothetical protein [unclassified Streptomyces]MYW68069.1 hypothetical protein [Streptomyces sp. SID8379]